MLHHCSCCASAYHRFRLNYPHTSPLRASNRPSNRPSPHFNRPTYSSVDVAVPLERCYQLFDHFTASRCYLKALLACNHNCEIAVLLLLLLSKTREICEPTALAFHYCSCCASAYHRFRLNYPHTSPCIKFFVQSSIIHSFS